LTRLNRKLIRDLASHWAQVAAIVAVVALGIIMFTGPLLATRDLADSVSAIYRRTGYEDFSVTVDQAPASTAGQVEALANVRAAEGRIVREAQARVRTRRLTVRVVSVPEVGRPKVNGLIVDEGRYIAAGQQGACMVERHLANELDIRPGSRLTVIRDTGEVDLEVTGVVVSPEYLRLVRSRAEYVTDPAQFGVIFVRYSQAASLFQMAGRIDNIVATVKNAKLLQTTMDAAGSLLKPYGVTGLTSGKDEPGAVTLDLEMKDINRIALFFSLLLLAVSSLAVYITMTQIVFSQQREIGVTRAIGYDRRTISMHYVGYGVVLGLGGAAVGVTAGYFLSGVYARIYANVFGLPFVQTSLYGWIILSAVAVGLLFSILGAVVPARHAVRMHPADAMRTEAGVALTPGKTARKPRMTERHGISSWLRIAFRNLGRKRRRTLLTWLGVVGTICLMVTASGGKDSVDYAVEKYLHGVLKWDVAAVWPVPIGKDMLARVAAIDGVAKVEPFVDVPGRVIAGGKSSDVQVQAYQEDSALHGRYPTAGSSRSPGPAQVVLNRGITTKLPVKKGGIVTIATPVGSLPFKVAGFVSEPFGGVCYVNLEYIQALSTRITGGPGKFNGVVIQTKPGASSTRVGNQVRDLPEVAQVITKAGILRIFEELVGAIKALFIIFYVMAFAMGFAIIFSMITVNLLERGREIATIRTLGAGRGMIFSFVTVETATVVVAALIPGILLGRLLEWMVIEKLLTSDRLAPDTVISWVTILFIVIAALAVMLISELPSVRKLWHLDLARMTKERAD
jgi:putative ABC transport system permease protein